MRTQMIPVVGSTAFSATAAQSIQLNKSPAPFSFIVQRVRISVYLRLTSSGATAITIKNYSDLKDILNAIFGSSIGLNIDGSTAIVRSGTNPGSLADAILLAHRKAPISNLRIGVDYSAQTTGQASLMFDFVIPVDLLANNRLAGLFGFQFGAARASGTLTFGACAASVAIGSVTWAIDTSASKFKVDMIGVDPGVPVRANPVRYQLDTFSSLGSSQNLITGVAPLAVGFVGEQAAAAGGLLVTDGGLDYQQDGTLIQSSSYFDPFVAIQEWADRSGELGRLIADLYSPNADGAVDTGYGEAISGVDGEGVGFLPVIPLDVIPSAAEVSDLRVVENQHTFKLAGSSTSAYGSSVTVAQVFLQPTANAPCINAQGAAVPFVAGREAWSANDRAMLDPTDQADPRLANFLSQRV